MIKINKLKKGGFVLQKDNIKIESIFNNWKLWLTKNEICKLFHLKRNIITDNIKNIFLSDQYDIENDVEKIFNKNINKKETFYSLDIIISLWYRFKSYNDTKFMINANNIIKKYNKKTETNLNIFSSNIRNIIRFIKKESHLL